MKKFALLFTVVFALVSQQVNAQCSACTAAFINCPPTGGLCNRLDTAYANHPYDKIINFYMPEVLTSPSVLAQCQCNQVLLRQITVTGVSNLPAGINYSVSNGGVFNVQNGDSLGCAHFCGTPLVPGLYSVAVHLLANVTAIGTPIGNVNQNNVPQQYYDTLLVLPDTSGGVASFTYGNNGSSACDSLTVDLNALYTAPAPNFARYFWNIGGQTVESKTPGSFTFTNLSQTQPDTFPVTLTTVFYNYIVKKVHIGYVSGGYCGDIEEPTCDCLPGFKPDPYVKFNSLGYSSPYISEDCNLLDYNNLNLSIALGTQSIDNEVWDSDNGPPFGSQDDLLGTFTSSIILGIRTFSNNNVDGYVEFDTIAGTTITETLNVIVNPYPATPVVIASQDTFCSRDSTRISVNNTYNGYSFEWYRDTVFLTEATDSFFYSNESGEYKVKVTNLITGCQSESAWKTITKMQSPAASVNVYYSGSLIFISPFPATGFTAEWYYNGTLVPGETGKFLPFLGNGEYQAVLYNTAFPSCRSVTPPNTIVQSDLNELADNSVYGVRVFPNPSNGNFTLMFETNEVQNISIYVRNPLGQLVSEKKFENFTGEFNESIDLSKAEKGVYFIAIETQSRKLNTKAVVQ